MNYPKFPKKPPTHAEILEEIRRYLDLAGIWHYKQWQGMGSLPGVSDIIGIYRGQYLAIEVKTGKDQLTEKQAEFLERVNLEDGIGFVARSVDDVITHFEIGKRKKSL